MAVLVVKEILELDIPKYTLTPQQSWSNKKVASDKGQMLVLEKRNVDCH